METTRDISMALEGRAGRLGKKESLTYADGTAVTFQSGLSYVLCTESKRTNDLKDSISQNANAKVQMAEFFPYKILV